MILYLWAQKEVRPSSESVRQAAKHIGTDSAAKVWGYSPAQFLSASHSSPAQKQPITHISCAVLDVKPISVMICGMVNFSP